MISSKYFLTQNGEIEDRRLGFLEQKDYTILMGSKNWKQVKTTIGNLFIDLGKLSFGSLILGSILRGGLNPFQTFIFGAAVAIVLFVVGIWIISTNKE